VGNSKIRPSSKLTTSKFSAVLSLISVGCGLAPFTCAVR
jgi:hypothetical protein